MPTEPTHYISISPALVILENKGPRFSTTVFKGFTTTLTASLVAPGGADQNKNRGWQWSVVPNGSGNVTLSNPNQQVVEVKGIAPGVVTLHASCGELTNTVEITIEETDLLIYAPDGYVYRVPHKVWANPHQQAVRPDEGVQVLPMDTLSTSVQSLLVDQVPVANVPEPLPSSSGGAMTTVADPSDNITCFLLNLNSILLSPPAPTPATPPSGKPKP